MKIPDVVEVYGSCYELIAVEDLSQDHGDLGATFPHKNYIVYDPDYEDERVVQTIIHELIHCVLDRTGIGEGMDRHHEESIAESISKFLVETFKIKFKE